MTSPTPSRPEDDIQLLMRRVERERKARLAAEEILEAKSRELHEANAKLTAARAELEQKMGKLQVERDRVLTFSRLDMLTGLVNRATFIGHLEEVLSTRLPSGIYHWLFLVDLRRFKKLNSAIGQHGGDAVLKTIAQRLLEVSRTNSGFAARMGGNEFAFSVAMSERDAANFGDYLRSILEAPIDMYGRRLRATVVIGAAGTNVAEASVESLRGAADYALFTSRNNSSANGGICVFDEKLQEEIISKLDLEVKLRRAIGTHAIEPWFQPIVDPYNSEKVSFEVLARWARPDGFVPPDDFIPLANRLGLRRQLDADLFLRACQRALPWVEAGWLEDLSFNVPPSDLTVPSFLEDLEALLRATPMPRDHLVMEITESVFIDDLDLARERLEAINAMGVRVALDDFGTGYSNLRSLVGLPLSKIKLDRSLVSDLGNNDRVAMLVSTITQWARAVNIGIVAEGVETETQLMVLKALGCTGLQGFYFGRALSAEQVEAKYGPLVQFDRLRA